MKKISILLAIAVVLGMYQNCAQKKNFSESAMSRLVPMCRDVSAKEVEPTLKWDWIAQLSRSQDSRWPEFDQLMASPMVADLNGDGFPEVVFITFTTESSSHFADTTGSAYIRNGVLRIVDGKTGRTRKSIGEPALAPYATQSPLLVDLDKDGTVEIIYLKYSSYVSGAYANRKMIALNYDGSLRWEYDLGSYFSNAAVGLTASDANNDGIVDILAGSVVVTEDSSRKPKALFQVPTNGQFETVYSALNPEKPSEGYLINSKGVTLNGVVKFQFDQAIRGLAVADIYPERHGLEIVATTNSYLAIHNGLTGTILKSVSLDQYNELKCPSNSIGGGPPSVGDFDGDANTLEIAVVTGRHLTVFDRNLNPKYKFITQDCSSLVTGLTSFDLNGDGKAEILYADEEYFRIYEIQNGSLREAHKMVNPSGTLYEYPVVADIDGNLTAEILVASNNYAAAGFYKDSGEEADQAIAAGITGLRAFVSSGEKGWMPTRPIWNQYSFHPDQFTDQADLIASAKMDSKIYRRNNQGQGVHLMCKQ